MLLIVALSGRLNVMRHILPRSFKTLQDGLATLLGCGPEARPGIIAGMLRRNPAEATGYWLQLVVSVGIASLGLVLGSTAVVIGAMLIAPLMGPIVSFGMGLAVGSPFLVLRSGARIVASVTVAVASSAILTRLLPFHELNAELAARTTPTALDLLIAGFCALAGVYASMRPGSDVASTAAGTSIGISLVPPLCASGYGFGTATWSVAGGAALLFLTNFVAIVVVGTICFAAAGFHQVHVRQLESEDMPAGNSAPIARAIAGRLEGVFASRGGPWLRLLMPLLLLVVVYVPLRKALDEVAWQIKARRLVQTAVQNLATRVVQSRIRIERGEVDLGLILLGSTADATMVKQQLDRELRALLSITPRLEILAVPDANAFAGLEAALHNPVPITVTHPPPSAQLEDARLLVQKAVERHWPSRSSGAPLAVFLSTSSEYPRISIVHLGNVLDAAALEVLGLALQSQLGTRVQLSDAAIPSAELMPGEDATAFIAHLAPIVERSKQIDSVWACVRYPAAAPSKPRAVSPKAEPSRHDQNTQLVSAVKGLFEGHPRARLEESDAWSLRFVIGACPGTKPE